eukprot:symbB.v1.2.018445.t1/scaffold1473.1/size116783/4
MIRAPRHVKWPNNDAWTGCGGNPHGRAVCAGMGNCSTDCQNCGASTHWRCCGSSDKDSEFCLTGTTPSQAQYNFELCGKPYDENAPELPQYVEAAW